MEYVIAVRYGVAPESVHLTKILADIPGVSVLGANDRRAQVKITIDDAYRRVESALAGKCLIEPVRPRYPIAT
jgi:hypothetical protein